MRHSWRFEKSLVVIGGLLLCNYDNISLVHGDAGNYLQVVGYFAYSARVVRAQPTGINYIQKGHRRRHPRPSALMHMP